MKKFEMTPAECCGTCNYAVLASDRGEHAAEKADVFCNHPDRVLAHKKMAVRVAATERCGAGDWFAGDVG